jgi:PucR C-terminal helix-turn-helix domain/GGDEF-like domain
VRPHKAGGRILRAVTSRKGAVPHGDWPTLEEVIANLDSEVLRVVRAPSAEEVRVSDVTILDPADPHSLQAGCVALGIGLSAGGAEVLELVERAGRRGVAAVVLRTDDEPPARLLEAAEALDVALLAVPPEMTWGQLYSLLRTAMVSAGTLGEAGAAGVPVGDLFALADAVATAVGGPVTIEDPHWRVLAYANLDYPIDEARRQTILGRQPPGVWQARLEEAGVARALRTGEAVVRFAGFEEEGLAPRMAAAVRAGDELLGSIWVAEAGAPLAHEAESALLRSAQLAAIHLICHRASDDVKRRTRGAFVREVLEGRVPLASAGAEVPFRMKGPLTALAFELTAGYASPAGRPDRILSLISLYCEDAHPEAMCALVEERFWALLPTPGARPRERTLELASTIVDRVERATGVPLVAGIGSSVPQVRDVPRSRTAAERALEVLAQRDLPVRAVHIEDVRAHAVLLELLGLAGQHPSLLQGKLEALVEHDRARGTTYTETLRSYLDCWGDSAAAARRVGVHPNTLRYRLRRLVELSALDLEDPDERLVTELQLRLRSQTAGAARPGTGDRR